MPSGDSQNRRMLVLRKKNLPAPMQKNKSLDTNLHMRKRKQGTESEMLTSLAIILKADGEKYKATVRALENTMVEALNTVKEVAKSKEETKQNNEATKQSMMNIKPHIVDPDEKRQKHNNAINWVITVAALLFMVASFVLALLYSFTDLVREGVNFVATFTPYIAAPMTYIFGSRIKSGKKA